LPLNIVILGPPGAGKGTQADLISEEAGIPHIATGDIIRSEIKSGTPFGKLVQSYNDRGELVPDQIIIDRLRERFQEPDTAEGFILEGFPRTLAQAEALQRMLDELDRGDVSVVLSFELPEELAEQRLLGRFSQQGRVDDTPELIRKRMGLMRVPEDVVKHYRAKGNLVGIHADRSIEEVFDEVQDVLESAAAR
jgi:adenylate kinase